MQGNMMNCTFLMNEALKNRCTNDKNYIMVLKFK